MPEEAVHQRGIEAVVLEVPPRARRAAQALHRRPFFFEIKNASALADGALRVGAPHHGLAHSLWPAAANSSSVGDLQTPHTRHKWL